MKVDVLVLDGVFDLGLSATLDCFATATELAALDTSTAHLRFDARLVGVRRHIKTAHGLMVPLATPPLRPELVVVPALGDKMPATLEPRLQARDVADARKQLLRWYGEGATLCAACTSTFVLASTGLLDGHKATTTWWLASMFRDTFEKVSVDESQMVVEAGRCMTAGAALSHLDLALALIRRESPMLAATVARYLVMDPRSSASSYAIPDHIAHNDAATAAFEGWVREHLHTHFSIAEAARAVGASERTLGRKIKQTLGKSPLAYVQDLRVERAVHLLRTSDMGIGEIADQVGYRDAVSLRVLLRRKTGRGIRELRARRWS